MNNYCKMKRIIIYAIFAFALGTLFSCSDFLEEKPVVNKSETDFTNKEGVTQLLTGMYAKLYDDDYFARTLSNYAYGDIMGGDANKGSQFNDQPDFTALEIYTFTLDNSYLSSKWAGCYNGVFFANNVIKVAGLCKDDLSNIQGESKDFYTETIAQARFMRAFWHFEAVKLFGAAVPFVDEEAMKASTNPQVSNVDDNGNYIYIWDKIAEDLQFAYENLPDTWATEQGRVNKWAAQALYAKVRLYQSSPYNGKNGNSDHWKDARTALEDVIAHGKDNKGQKYCLADTYETLYTAGKCDWTGESVFDIQMTISGTVEVVSCINGTAHIGLSGALGTGGWGFYQPSYDFENAHIVDSKGLPLMDDSYRNHKALTMLDENNVPHTDLDVYTDPRLDVSSGRFDTPYLDWSVPQTTDGWVRDVSNGGVYLNKKNIPRKADKGSLSISTTTCSSAKNFHLIRYADVLLWYAEVLIHDGEYAEAGKYINMVRARAANDYVRAVDPNTMEESPSAYVFDDIVDGTKKTGAAANYRLGLYPDSQFTTAEGATLALRWERRIEMALEGHRWYDLARWGIIGDALNDYVKFEKTYLAKYASCSYNSNWVMMPIPYNQIRKMNGLLVQNEVWK